MAFIDNYAFNIENPQKLEILWSPDIVWDYDNDGYPSGNETLFDWKAEFMPYYTSPDGFTVYHVWMKYKVGDKGSWSLPMRVNYPTVVKGEKGDKGAYGEQGTRGQRGAVGKGIDIQYADEYYNIVPSNSSASMYVRFRIEGENWSVWLKAIGTDGVDGADGIGTGGTGVPSGGTDGQVLSKTALSYAWIDKVDIYNNSDAILAMGVKDDTNSLNHDKYTDGEAVTAMGVKGDSNPLNHDRYTGAEVLALFSATSPIDILAGTISHKDTDGNKHIPASGTQEYSITLDGSGNLVWKDALWMSDLDDTAILGATDKLYSANKILTLFAGLQSYGIRYVWTDAVARAAEVGMSADDLGVQDDTRDVYKYSGIAWEVFFNLDAIHNHDDLYFTKSQVTTMLADYYTKVALQGDGTAQVHWNNVTNVPSFIQLTGISATSPILYDDTTGVISHATSMIGVTTNTSFVVLNRVIDDGFGHLAGIEKIDLETSGKHMIVDGDGLQVVKHTSGGDVTTNYYNPFDDSISYELALLFAGSSGNYGTSNKAARSDHKHSDKNLRITVTDSLIGADFDLDFVNGILNNYSLVSAGPVGTIGTDDFNGDLGSIIAVTTKWYVGTSTDTSWSIVHINGNDNCSFERSSGIYESNANHIELVGDPDSEGTYNLVSHPSETVLDVLHVIVNP